MNPPEDPKTSNLTRMGKHKYVLNQPRLRNNNNDEEEKVKFLAQPECFDLTSSSEGSSSSKLDGHPGSTSSTPVLDEKGSKAAKGSCCETFQLIMFALFECVFIIL